MQEAETGRVKNVEKRRCQVQGMSGLGKLFPLDQGWHCLSSVNLYIDYIDLLLFLSLHAILYIIWHIDLKDILLIQLSFRLHSALISSPMMSPEKAPEAMPEKRPVFFFDIDNCVGKLR